MAILVPEQRLELKMFLPVIAAPILFEIGRPARIPRILADGVRRRAEREDIDEHPLIIADPVVRPEIDAVAALGIPAHRDSLLHAATGRQGIAFPALDECKLDRQGHATSRARAGKYVRS